MGKGGSMKRKPKKSKRKRGKGKVLIFLILAGIGVGAVFFFQKEIVNIFKPWLQAKGVLKEEKKVVLYFCDPQSEYLIGEKREIARRGDVEDEAEELISELTKGPRGKLIPTLPRKTKLLDLQIDERGVARVSFSEELSKDHPGGTSAEMMTIYSIVNSLTLNFPEIKRVQILVDGKGMETLAGHVSSGQPLGPNPGLIKKPGNEKAAKKPRSG
jgi:hypothetical protein